jgi:hypothetical protein
MSKKAKKRGQSRKKITAPKRRRRAEKEKACRHRWGAILTQRGRKIFPVPLAQLCLKCGLLQVGTQTIRISRNRLDMGNLPIQNASKVLIIPTGRLKVPVGTNLYD